ncbi:hypothetical protein M8R20_16560 [Pseudomonas sp. R2.Fl]|nr:hypothetical protein [Pseudomonas sp. R2.Fl]
MSANTQTSAPAPQVTDEDEVEAALAWHQGDARAALRTLLDDCRHLRLQLALAESAMSPGMTRGWRPSYKR